MALSESQIAQLWVDQGGNPKFARLMANIAIRESGGRPKINNRGLNKNGTVDWGLFQVNDIWRRDPVVGPLFRSGAILTPEGATKAAIHILKVQGPKAWATYNPSVDQKYLGGFSGATSGGQNGGGSATHSSTTTTTKTIPGVDNSAQRQQVLAAYLANTHKPDALVALAAGLLGAKDTPAQTVTTSSSSSGGRPTRATPTPKVSGGKTLSTTFGGVTEQIKAGAIPHVAKAGQVPQLQGVVAFDGKPVAAWVGYVLDYARRHGWTGTLSEGYRTDAQQTGIYNSGIRPAAKPRSLGGGGSNHEIKTFPGGAADVTQAAQLAAILAKSPYRSLLQWAGSKDPVHFSHPHNGSY